MLQNCCKHIVAAGRRFLSVIGLSTGREPSACATVEPLEERALFSASATQGWIPPLGVIRRQASYKPTEIAHSYRMDRLRSLAISPYAAPAIKVLQVPAYTWYYGCVPTAIGTAIGYWDTKGFGELIANSDARTMDDQVKETIASAAHRTAGQENAGNFSPYYGWGDWHNSASLPNHQANPDCISDYIKTEDGTTFMNNIAPGLRNFLGSRNLENWSIWQQDFADFTWDQLVSSINAGHPLVALVDHDGDGVMTHAAPVFGYNSNTHQFAAYDSEHTEVKWYDFGPVEVGREYGIHSLFHIEPTVRVSIAATVASVDEGGVIKFRLTRTNALDIPITVTLQARGSARNGVDYRTAPKTVTIGAGRSSTIFSLTTIADQTTERPESVGLNILPGLYDVDPNAYSTRVIINDTSLTAQK